MNYENKTIPIIVGTGIYRADMIYKNIKITPKRHVSLYELELCINGGYSYINGEKHKVDMHNIICAKPGSIRRTELPFTCFYIHLIVEDTYFKNLLNSIPDIFVLDDVSRIRELFTSLTKEYSIPRKNGELIIESRLLELIFEIYISSQGDICNNSTSHSAMLISNAVKYINAHYNEKINLDMLAKNVHLSKIYFLNTFRAAVGITPHEYIQNLRFAESKKMLILTDKLFGEIAYDCGFSSQSYFNYAFKNKFGVSPKEYKMEIQKKYSKQ